MSQIDGKWVKDSTIRENHILLRNSACLKSEDFGGGGTVDLIQATGSDEIELCNKTRHPFTPVNNEDLVNKGYVLDVLAGLRDPKDAVQLASTGNLTLSGEQTIDGVLTSNSRVLVKNQTTASENGIYVTAAGAWTRATDADEDAEVTQGMSCLVTNGTINARKLYVLTTADPITVGTTALSFAQAPNPANFLVPKQVEFTLGAGDITNGYIDLAHEAESESISVTPVGGPKQQFNTDYTISVVSNVSRVTFAGNLAAIAAAGDVLLVEYQYATS